MSDQNWPDDVDGDVFRRLASQAFDFSRPCAVDFNIDFDQWPPSDEALSTIEQVFPGAVARHESANAGYVLYTEQALLTYERVMHVQVLATQIAAPYGGRCESWGVMH